MLPIKDVTHLLHLRDVGVVTDVECVLNDRLFGTRVQAEGGEQSLLTAQAGVDLHHTGRAHQQQAKVGRKFLRGCVLDAFLGNVYLLAQRSEQSMVLHVLSQSG